MGGPSRVRVYEQRWHQVRGRTYITDIDPGRVVAMNPVALAGLDGEHFVLETFIPHFTVHFLGGIDRTGPEDAAIQSPIVGML